MAVNRFPNCTATINQGATAGTIAGVPAQTVLPGMEISFGSRWKRGVSYAIKTWTVGQSGATFELEEAAEASFSAQPFAVDTMTGSGGALELAIASFTAVSDALVKAFGAGVSLASASKTFVIDRGAGAGTLGRWLFQLSGASWFGIEHRTVGGVEQLQFNGYLDGATPTTAAYLTADGKLAVPRGGTARFDNLDLDSLSTPLVAGSSMDLGSVASRRVDVVNNGSNPIVTSLGTGANKERLVTFPAGLTLTHNATTLILPGAASIVTAAGDTAYATSDALGNWRVRSYQNASAVLGQGGGGISTNFAAGFRALRANTTGYGNTAAGTDPLLNNTTGANNAAFGNVALTSNTTGSNHVAIGSGALYTNTTGEANIAVGQGALFYNVSGSYNVAIGQTALLNNTTGSGNMAIGQSSLQSTTSGANNVAVGQQALQINTTGGSNVAIGQGALIAGVTSSFSTGVGRLALYNTDYENTTGLGYGATVTGANQVQLGNGGTTVYAYGAVQNRSDARDKADVRDTVLGLDFLLALRPVDFRWDMREDYREDFPEPVIADADDDAREAYRAAVAAWSASNAIGALVPDGTKRRRRYHHGLIAQEVRAAVEALGVEFGGYQDHARSGGDDVLSIGYAELIGPLIKAVQELAARVVELEARPEG